MNGAVGAEVPADELAQALRVLDALQTSDAIVPALWTLEVANGLLTAERRGRLDAAAVDRVVRMILDLPIAFDPDV